MQAKTSLVLGVGMIVFGLFAAALLITYSPVSAHENERSEIHEEMHRMMDAMMGEGHSDAMHEAMPGSEQMMEACAEAMEEGDISGMRNMMRMMRMMGGMDGMDHMMPGVNGMMRGDR